MTTTKKHKYVYLLFCSGGEFLSVNKCFQWDRVPSIYQWEQSLKEMKWFCPSITILT